MNKTLKTVLVSGALLAIAAPAFAQVRPQPQVRVAPPTVTRPERPPMDTLPTTRPTTPFVRPPMDTLPTTRPTTPFVRPVMPPPGTIPVMPTPPITRPARPVVAPPK